MNQDTPAVPPRFQPDPKIIQALKYEINGLALMVRYITTGAVPLGWQSAKDRHDARTRTKVSVPRSTVLKELERIRGELNLFSRSQEWVNTALILPVIEYTCQHCGSIDHATGGTPLVKRTHPKHGSTTIPYTAEPGTENLKHEICTVHIKGHMCRNCFPNATQVRCINDGQLELPL